MIMGIFKKLFGKKEGYSKQSNQTVSDEHPENDKHYIDFDVMHKKVLVYLESAYRHQEIVFRRATETNRIALGEILAGLFKIDGTSIESMAVMYHLDYAKEKSVDETILYDTDAIWNYDLFAYILKNKTEDGHYTQGLFHETTLVVKCKERNYILTITSIGGIDTLKYLRVTLMSPDNSETDDCISLKSNNKPIIISFILSYSEMEENPELDLFDKIESSTREKLKSLDKFDEIDEVEEEYTHGMDEFRQDYYYGYGKYLYGQNRFFDSYITLERFYNYLKPYLNRCDESWMEAYYETCNMIGACLSKLGREDEAAYYYKQGVPKLTLEQPNNLALCKARLGDPSGMWLMNNWLMMVAKKYGDHKNWSEAIKQFSVDVPVALVKSKKEIEAHFASSHRYDGIISLGFVLDRLFGIKQKNLANCMFIYDMATNQFLTKMEDKEAITNYSLNVEQAKDKVFVLSCTHVYYNTDDKEDVSILCINAPIIISTHSIKTKDSAAAMRVDIMRCNFANDDDKRQREKINTPLNTTFCIGLSKGYNYSTSKEDLLEAIKKAIVLEKERQFIEAYKLAKWVYDCTLHLIKDEKGLNFSEEDDPLLWEIFIESSYRIGFCMMELDKPQVAAYYLEIASNDKGYEHIQEYINCLANLMDPQALEVVNEVIEHSPKPETEEKINHWNYHMAFLKRRKAYILIDKGELSEAERLLREMIKDPLCKEFAEGELKYIEQLKRQ
ncbi:MAG: hypothetical protein IJ659_03075 [Alloprevotella sp.]|nr:hypothetical protein [Alloprevotella sp.]